MNRGKKTSSMYKAYIDEVFFIIFIEVNKKYRINIKLN